MMGIKVFMLRRPNDCHTSTYRIYGYAKYGYIICQQNVNKDQTGAIKLVLVYILFCFGKTRFKLLVLSKCGESEKPVLKEFL